MGVVGPKDNSGRNKAIKFGAITLVIMIAIISGVYILSSKGTEAPIDKKPVELTDKDREVYADLGIDFDVSDKKMLYEENQKESRKIVEGGLDLSKIKNNERYNWLYDSTGGSENDKDINSNPGSRDDNGSDSEIDRPELEGSENENGLKEGPDKEDKDTDDVDEIEDEFTDSELISISSDLIRLEMKRLRNIVAETNRDEDPFVVDLFNRIIDAAKNGNLSEESSFYDATLDRFITLGDLFGGLRHWAFNSETKWIWAYRLSDPALYHNIMLKDIYKNKMNGISSAVIQHVENEEISKYNVSYRMVYKSDGKVFIAYFGIENDSPILLDIDYK